MTNRPVLPALKLSICFGRIGRRAEQQSLPGWSRQVICRAKPYRTAQRLSDQRERGGTGSCTSQAAPPVVAFPALTHSPPRLFFRQTGRSWTIAESQGGAFAARFCSAGRPKKSGASHPQGAAQSSSRRRPLTAAIPCRSPLAERACGPLPTWAQFRVAIARR
jgi:hypothetical protein